MLGAALSIPTSRFSSAPRPSSWWHDESKSGGIVIDLSLHDFDQLNLVLGKLLAVIADPRGRMARSRRSSTKREGGLASCGCSWLSTRGCDRGCDR